MFGSYTRVFGFARQVLADARNKPVLFAPLVMNIALAVPVNAVLILASLFVPDGVAMLLMPVGLSALYFIDYFSGGLNTAMVYEQQTTGNATLGSAFKRTMKAAIGIAVFAIVSGLLDFAVQVLSQRRLHMLRPLLLMIRSFWSTATFVIMPTMVIEGLGFGAAFKRSKELAEKDPTQIGVGYIGIGLVTSLISMVGFLLVSFVGTRILWPISPLLGLAFELVVINATWAIAAYLKSTYYTCFYMWTRECERHGGVNPAFAPTPLRNVLADVNFGSMGVQLVPAAAAVAVAVAGAQGGFAPPPQPGYGAPQSPGFAAPAQPGGFAAPPQPGFGAPQPQPGFGAPQPQPGFGAPPQGFGAPPPQPGFGAPPPQPGFGAPPPQPGFGAPPPQPGFGAPQPQPGFGAPPPQFAAPAPQPQFAAPQPQFAAPAPQPQFAAPAPQPQFAAPAPQPQFAAPAPRPFAPPAAQASAPPPRPFPQPQPQPAAPAPQPYAAAPAPRPAPAPQAYAAAPAPRPYPQPQPPPAAPASRPLPPGSAQAPDAREYPSLDSGELQGEATVIQSSPFDDDESTRVG